MAIPRSLLGIIILLFILKSTSCATIYTVPVIQKAVLIPTALFQCFKNSGIQSVSIFLVLYETGQYSPVEFQNIINAKSAGLQVEVVYILSRAIPLEAQAQKMKSELVRSGLVNNDDIWILPAWESLQDGTDCDFLKKFLLQLRRNKIFAQIVGHRDLWTQTFKQPTACPDVSVSELWWWPLDGEQNGQPNFDGYNQIGGWESPDRKFYGLVQICKSLLLQSYGPDEEE